MSGCPSNLERERYLGGEHPDDDVRAHMEGCQACKEWLEQARAEGEELVDAVDEEVFAAAVADRVEQRSGGERARFSLLDWLLGHRPQVAAALVTCCLALVLGIMLRQPTPGPGPGPGSDLITIKGGASVKVHRKRGQQVSLLEPGQRCQDGDALRFEVFPGKLSHVLVLALEGEKVSVYHPFEGKQSVAIPPGRWTTLPSSVILEGTADELLVFLFSATPLAAERARAAAASALATARGRLQAVEQVDLPVAQKLRLITKGKSP